HHRPDCGGDPKGYGRQGIPTEDGRGGLRASDRFRSRRDREIFRRRARSGDAPPEGISNQVQLTDFALPASALRAEASPLIVLCIPPEIERCLMDVNGKIHAQLVKAGVKLAASLPDDWVNNLITRVEKGNEIRHVRVGREAETIAVCAGAFFGGVR